jgi:hypothetical protein
MLVSQRRGLTAGYQTDYQTFLHRRLFKVSVTSLSWRTTGSQRLPARAAAFQQERSVAYDL